MICPISLPFFHKGDEPFSHILAKIIWVCSSGFWHIFLEQSPQTPTFPLAFFPPRFVPQVWPEFCQGSFEPIAFDPWFAFASRFPPTLCPQIFPKVCHPMSPWVVTFLKFINTRVISLCSPSGLWTPANGVQKLWVKNNGSTFFYWFPLLHNMLSSIAQSFSQVLFASFWDKKCDRRHRQTGANGPLLDAAL